MSSYAGMKRNNGNHCNVKVCGRMKQSNIINQTEEKVKQACATKNTKYLNFPVINSGEEIKQGLHRIHESLLTRPVMALYSPYAPFIKKGVNSR